MLKKSTPSRVTELVVCALLLLLGVSPLQHVWAAPPIEAIKTQAKVVEALQTEAAVPVIVALVDPVSVETGLAVRADSVAQVQLSVLSSLSADDFTLYQRYSHVPAFVGLANAAAIASLQANPQVAYIQSNERMVGHLAESVPAMGADVVQNTYGLTGAGVRVAVLDTGINTTHDDLSGDIVAQHCFLEGSTFGDGIGSCAPGNTPEGTNAEDENGHGSNVSGIITSDGVVSSVGFAPDSEIVAIRVLDASSSGWLSDWVSGMNWIIANQNTLQVDIINMSLGTFALFPGNCDSIFPTVLNAVSQLRAKNITIFASSGNQGSATELASPACNGGVVAVGATYDGNVGRQPASGDYSAFGGSWPACFSATTSLQTVTCFTNSNNQLDILAPGAPITSDYMFPNGLSTFTGTSQASPTAAGIAALLLQYDPTLTPNAIEAALKASGTPLVDPKNGLSFPLINALAVYNYLQPQPPALLTPGSSTTVRKPVFSWGNAIGNVVSYELQLDQSNPPTTTVLNAKQNQYVPATPLNLGVYYWRIRTITANDMSDWSAVQTLNVVSGTDAAPGRNYFTTGTPTLTWAKVDWALQYEIWVDDTSTFVAPLRFSAIIPGANLSAMITPALPDGVYFWRVRALGANGRVGGWSAFDSFEIDAS